MLLEIEVWGSRDWYERALPLPREAGLCDRPDLAWSDPEADGERTVWRFDVQPPTVWWHPSLTSHFVCELRGLCGERLSGRPTLTEMKRAGRW